jgi:DNA-binding IclR family transcriptional regulator
MNEVKPKPYAGVALLAKTFQMLDLFQIESPTWTQVDLVRATGLNRSTVNRLVRYLVSTGYLVQLASSGKYSLGLAAIDLGHRANASFDFRSLCQPALEKLAAMIDETIILTSYDRANNTSVCVDQIARKHGALRVFERVGSTFPLHAGAAPKAILANLPEPDREAIIAGTLKKYTKNTMIDIEELKADIGATIDRGYSLSWEETYEGIAGIGAPVMGPDKLPLGSIAVALPIQRVESGTIEYIGTTLLKVTNSIISGGDVELADGETGAIL